MIDELKKSLLELGFSDKEGEVYISMLELGPASVQDIAKKAGVNRSTTYVMIESLKRRGLLSTFERGKKIYFSAESPEKLKLVMQDEIADVKAKQARMEAALPRLQAIFNAHADKPHVRYLEGEHALMQVRNEIVESRSPHWEFYSVDEALMQTTRIAHAERIEATKKMTGRALFTIKPGFEVPYFDDTGVEIRTLPYDAFAFSGDLALVGNRVYLLSMKTIGAVIIIENEEMAEIIRTLYEAAWSCAQIWIKPEDWGKEHKNNSRNE
jgi:sugar-specific transcriptional regulator TrmB